MLDVLEFLPVAEVPAGLQFLRSNMPNYHELHDLVDYFYTGSAWRIQRPQASAASAQGNAVFPVRLRRIPSSFPPDT